MPDLFHQEREFERQVKNMGNAYEKAMTPKTAEQAADESRSASLGCWVATVVFLGLAFLAFVFLHGI